MKTLNQGIHADVPIDEYIRDPAPQPSLSTGTAQALIDECPARAWHNHPRLNPKYENSASTVSDIGSLAHAVLLEGGTDKLVVVPFADWRKKEAQELRDTARAQGKIPVLESKVAEVSAMVEVAREALLKAQSEVGVFGEMKIEQTIIWQDHGIWCRSRPDMLAPDFRLALDYKTSGTSAHPDALARFASNQGWDLQAGLIRAGVYACTEITPDVVFMVQETAPPYLVSFIGLDPTFAEVADRKVERAVKVWAECLSSGHWPGYPSRVAWVAPMPWEIAKVESIMGEK